MTIFRPLALAGSLRQGSSNRGTLRVAQELASWWVKVRFFDIGTLPFFNEDLEAAGDPEVVWHFKEAIRDPNAVLIATPSITARCRECWPTRLTGPHGQRARASCATNR